MEKNQYKLCFEALRRFNKVGILDGLILIGNWCLYFYKGYFENISYIDISTIKTRDIDFLVPIPAPQSQDKFHSKSPTFFHSDYALPPPSFLRFLAL